jgi:antirestriction protein
MSKMRIFVQNLCEYNKGKTIGKWLDLPFTREEFEATLKEIGVDGVTCEEWFIADHENFPFNIGEHVDLEYLLRLSKLISEKGFEEAYAVGYGVVDWEEWLGTLENDEYVFHKGMNLEDVAYALLEEFIPSVIFKHISSYIDYKKYARDLELDMYFETPYGVVRLDY